MDNQLAQPEVIVRQITLMVIVMMLVISTGILGCHLLRVSDPYVKSVLSLKGNSEQGHAMFQINCSDCHGLQGHGKVGPSLTGISKRKSKIDLIHQVTDGNTPPMPKFQPSPQEMADLLSYLEEL
ncbi:MAG: cytochrome c [Symploca sp. SIO2E9]|nr:cytochrome c [Symploca sp. SIO2E9]